MGKKSENKTYNAPEMKRLKVENIDNLRKLGP